MELRELRMRPFVLRVLVGTLLCSVVGIVCASNLHGQTLFAEPDTTANIVGYRHIDECWHAGERISKTIRAKNLDTAWSRTIWWDTVEAWRAKELQAAHPSKQKWFLKRRPEPAIQAIRTCLTMFNADTATWLSSYSALQMVRILLFAHRDDDARQVAERLLDSTRHKSKGVYIEVLGKLVHEYATALPHRFDVAMDYLSRLLALRAPGDSTYWAIDALLAKGHLLDEQDDTVAGDRARDGALALNDSTPDEERNRSPGANLRLLALRQIVAKDTKEEALDSLEVSNLAYELWWANTVEGRVYGEDAKTTRAEMVERLKKRKLPDLQGDFYYAAITDTARGTVRYSRVDAPRKGALRVPGKITRLMGNTALAFCHIETEVRTRADEREKNRLGKGCMRLMTTVRSLQHEMPDVDWIAIGRTYGTVGQIGPLTPAQEADTIAKLLAFHRVPVRLLIVEATKYFNLPAPDGRRIDIKTPNQNACAEAGGCSGWIDKDGDLVRNYFQKGGWEYEKRFYEVLKHRPSQP